MRVALVHLDGVAARERLPAEGAREPVVVVVVEEVVMEGRRGLRGGGGGGDGGGGGACKETPLGLLPHGQACRRGSPAA